MLTIGKQILKIGNELPKNVRLVAISKTKPIDMLMEAYEAGQRHFGENKVQEMTQKQEAMPKDIQWHMVGHLQRNKVRQVVPFVYLIHSIDSVRLLQEVDKEAARVSRVVNCLLQVHIAREETKFGFDEAELMSLINSKELSKLPFVNVMGLMGMATFTENQEQIRAEFSGLKVLFDRINATGKIHLTELSMGMSGDYIIGIECGSTLVRIGSSIFGVRNYV